MKDKMWLIFPDDVTDFWIKRYVYDQSKTILKDFDVTASHYKEGIESKLPFPLEDYLIINCTDCNGLRECNLKVMKILGVK